MALGFAGQGIILRAIDHHSPKSDVSQPGDRLLWSLVGIALGIGLLYAATRKVDFNVLVGTLKGVKWGWGSGILAAANFFILVKAWRWQLLLRFMPKVRFATVFSAVYAGLAANFLIVHVGEFLRTTMIARQCNASISAVLATVIVERTLDFIALLLLFALLWLTAPGLPAVVNFAAMLTLAIVAIAIVALRLLLEPPTWFAAFAQLVARPFPESVKSWFVNQIEQSKLGLATIRDLRLMVAAIAASVLQWAFVVLAIWWSALAIGVDVSIVGAAVTFVLIVIGLALPSSPMQIGATQLAFAIGFGIDGTPATVAVAASIVYTAFLILPIMVIGGVATMRGGSMRIGDYVK